MACTKLDSLNKGTETNIIKINTQKDLTGTVEITPTSMIWHLPSGDIYYGLPRFTPATWIDEKGQEQMAVIDGNTVYLDKELSGGDGELLMGLNELTVLSQLPGQTVQLSTTKTPGTNNTDSIIVAIIIIIILAFYLSSRK